MISWIILTEFGEKSNLKTSTINCKKLKNDMDVTESNSVDA